MEIEHSCPQCGAPVVLAESDRLFSCPFCRVRLYLWSAEEFRYRIPPAPAASARQGLVYVPYGRFRGMVFDLEHPEGSERVLDTSFLAAPGGPFPNSLGLRPQALRLYPAAFEKGDRCLKTRISDDTLGLLPSPAATRPPRRIFRSVGEVRSLIYAPFYRDRGRWHDGVLGTPLPQDEGQYPAPEFVGEEEKTWDRHFIPTICPDCGWDLAAVPESCLLFCPQCRSGWEPSGAGLRPFPFFSQPVAGGDDGRCYLPFWYFKLPYLPPDYFRLPLAELLNLQAGQSPPWERQPVRSVYLVPAFKISPRLFLRLARGATAAPCSETELEPRLPNSFHPVTLPAQEALEGLAVLQACLDQEAIVLNGSRPRIEPGDWERKLVFIPFLETAYELIQPQSGWAVSKQCLHLGKYI
jgi:endogenous inhibitor of DNA gyrase (YacG/DUF329 family)